MSVSLIFGPDEKVEVPWSLKDSSGSSVIADSVAVKLVAHSGASSSGSVTDNGDGTGIWTIDCTALSEHRYHWWFLVEVGTEDRRPDGMWGTLEIRRP